jgi:acetylornithine/succinyldiaminopimelate/putrescine aminotransferase
VELDVQRHGRSAPEVAAALLAGQRAASGGDVTRLVLNAVTPTALRLAPSLMISEGEIDLALATLAAALEDPS